MGRPTGVPAGRWGLQLPVMVTMGQMAMVNTRIYMERESINLAIPVSNRERGRNLRYAQGVKCRLATRVPKRVKGNSNVWDWHRAHI